jgi:peptidoglycan/LPS O-acetylase OafA/YrhL
LGDRVELTDQIDIYCERMGPEFWAEPVNALINLAFLIAAAIMALRLRKQRLPRAWGLVGLLTAIGIGSFLFHSHATGWAALADVIPIALFILVYVFIAHRDYFGQPLWAAWLAVFAFLPYTALAGAGFGALPFFEISAGYWPVVLALLLYAGALRRRGDLARGFVIGAAILSLSLVARSLDLPLCGAAPFGTHFLWHILNAIMLGYMIELYRRHMLAGRAARG